MKLYDTSSPSILGERPHSLSLSGKIRPGIKVLTRKAAEVEGARECYRLGLSEGLSWDEIALKLLALPGMRKSIANRNGVAIPLTPKNAGYFRIHRGDFVLPEAADEIIRRYSSDGEDGVQVYRIPLIFTVDSEAMVLPHKLAHWNASELVHWSEYDRAGARHCMTRGKVAYDERAKRHIKPGFGRSGVSLGPCDPDGCPHFQSTTSPCKLSGAIRAYVYGVPSAGVVEIPTTSFYGLTRCRDALNNVAESRGSIVGVREDGAPLFWLTKVKARVSRLDRETGLVGKVEQMLPVLVDSSDPRQTGIRLTGPDDAKALTHQPPGDHEDEVDDGQAEAEEQAESQAAEPKPTEEDRIAAAHHHIGKWCDEKGLDRDLVQKWGDNNLHDGWGKDLDQLRALYKLILQDETFPELLKSGAPF